MISKSAVYHKSARGTEALAKRDPALTPKLRSTLILVDGKRGFDELAKVAQVLGDAEQLLGALADLGFIEPASGSVAEPVTIPAPIDVTGPASVPAPPSSQHPTVPLADAKRYAVRRLTDLLGPTAEDLCLRLEGARNAQEFMAVIHRAEGVLRDFGNARLAAQFTADIEAHRPG